MSLRVCILCQANPIAWVPHYISAFKQRCDVLTIGPSLPAEALLDWDTGNSTGLNSPHYIETDLDKISNLYDILPAGWYPDLVVSISGGGVPMFTNTTHLQCPCVFLSIDTWQCLTDYMESRYYDIVFAAQKEFLPKLQASGCRYVFWLPLACSPERHYPLPEEAITYDIAFAGSTHSPVHKERKRLLDLLQQHFNVFTAERVLGDPLCRVFARGRIAFNHSAVREVNMRIFEVLAMQRPLLTNRSSAANGLYDLFEEHTHLITYNTDDELLRRARELIDSPSRCETIAQNGYKEVLEKHTYLHRVDTILSIVKSFFPKLGQSDMTPERTTRSRLVDFLPKIPGVVVDIGLGLELSRYSAHRIGVQQFVGISQDHFQATRRKHSFDVVYENIDTLGRSSVDTVVVSDENAYKTFPNIFSLAHHVLHAGGTLLLKISPNRLPSEFGEKITIESLRQYFVKKGFHLLTMSYLHENVLVLMLKKFTRSVKEITFETFASLNLMDFPAEEIASRVPEDL